jgi:putative phage-type endonuclease
VSVTVAETGERLDEAAWLAVRRQTIGASEAAAALGVDEFCSPLELWARKLGKIPDREPSIAMRAGKALEPLLASLYAEEVGGMIVAEQVYYRHPTLPLSATVDGFDQDDTPVEFKTIDPQRAARLLPSSEETADIPEGWVIQAHQQMLLTGARCVRFGVLVGHRDFRTYLCERNDALLEGMVPNLVAFWRLVETQEPPEFLSADPRILQAVYPPVPDEFEGGEPLRATVDLYAELGKLLTTTQARRDDIKARILAECKGRQCLLTDGRRLKISQSWRHEYTVKPALVSRLDILKARS